MAKAGLANQLLGKTIVPKPEYGNPKDGDTGPNCTIWSGMKPNLAGQYIATVQAAWVQEGEVKVAATDPFGNNSEFYLKSVNINTMPEGRNPV